MKNSISVTLLQIKRVRRLIKQLDPLIDPVQRGQITETLNEELIELKQYMADDSEFLLLARQLIEPFLASITPF